MICSSLRHGNRGGTGSVRLLQGLDTTDDEQERDHERAQVDEQWATSNPVSGVEAGGDEADEDAVQDEGSDKGLLKTGLLEEVRSVGEKDRCAVPELVVEWHKRDDGSALEARCQR